MFGWLCVAFCNCFKCGIATKSCFDPNAHVRILYRIAIVVIISPIPYCLVWYYAIYSRWFFFVRCYRFVCIRNSFEQQIYSMCIFSWVFVGSCHGVVFFLFISLIFICFSKFGHQCVFPLANFFFPFAFTKRNFFKWPICSTYVLYQPNDAFGLFRQRFADLFRFHFAWIIHNYGYLYVCMCVCICVRVSLSAHRMNGWQK